MKVKFKTFTPNEHQTWKMLFTKQTPLRSDQIVPEFSRGLDILEIDEKQVPSLDSVNAKLLKLSGFKGVAVEGLEEGPDFYRLLAEGEFPVGNFIRDQSDLAYTPAPDVFHDCYGHLPFFADRDYGDFCREFGRRASRVAGDPDILQKYERLFWFTIEFGLIETPKGRRIFGAGIASSFGECAYSLDEKNGPKVVPFDLKAIRDQDFRIDQMQPVLFVLKDRMQLFKCLDEFERLVKKPALRLIAN